VGVEVKPVNVRDADEIERAVTTFARTPNGGLILTASALAVVHRDLTIALAIRHCPRSTADEHTLPAVAWISYGPNIEDQFRRAATYVDRILKGEKPADLPVQAPTKYDLVINIKTTKVIGLTVPPALLAPANEVIE
jgi:putative tryptophan/tyrosine transport system substrate-binding protein